MWSGVSRLLIGFVLFALAGWFVVHAAFGWNSVWQKQQVVAAKRRPVVLVDPTLASDPSIEDAKMKVIGPLANAVEPVDNPSEIKQPPPSPAAPNAFDHVQKPTSSAPIRLHNTFVVKTYRFFAFQVPAHTTSPKFRGAFKSYFSNRDKSDAVVEALLLDEQQFNQFVHGNSGTTVFSNESASGDMDLTLNATPFEPKKYYLVFRTPDARSRVVTADFTAIFD